MGLLLYILSLILRAILVPVSIIYTIIKLFVQSHFDRAFKYSDESFRQMAVAIDKYGNTVCKELFNDTLIKKNSAQPFGNIGQTISAVLGMNYMAGTLTTAGLFLNNALNFFWKNHTIKSAEDAINKMASQAGKLTKV